MDQATNQQSATDDQELAKVLAGVNDQIEKEQTNATTGLHFEETPSAGAVPPVVLPPASPALPPMPPAPTALPTPAASTDDNLSNSALDDIKKDALKELRPLVDKLNVSAEEKFDTYLLLLRSTDDQSLIAPAHDAAKGIVDEARRAQALLDVIKEIDYLSSPHTV